LPPAAPPPEGKAQSLIHRLDPRTKIVLALALALLLFAVGSLPVAAAQVLLFAGLALAAGIPPGKIFPRPWPLALMLATVVAMQALFMSAADGAFIGPLVPEWVPAVGGSGAVGLDGILLGLTVACRVAALAVLMPLLVATTEPRLLAFGIAGLGAGYRIAHVITSTINLAAVFQGEVRLILDARRLRGAGPSRGSRGPARLLAQAAEYRAIAFPLVVKVARRSLAVSLAMDSRAFGARRKRTWLVSARMSAADYAALAAAAAYSAAVLAADRALGG